VESGNGFVIQVKGNRPNVKSIIKNHIASAKSYSIHSTEENKKGRKDKRTYEVYKVSPSTFPDGYHHIQSIIHVTRKGIRKNKNYENSHFYISDQKYTAKQFSVGIRGHWSIENNLHRVKDVEQKEDTNKIINMTLAANVSILQTLVINIFRKAGIQSLKHGNEKYANKIRQCYALINST